MPRATARGRLRARKRKAVDVSEISSGEKNEDRKKQKLKKPTSRIKAAQAAIRPRLPDEGTVFLRDLRVVHVRFFGQKPKQHVECVNYHQEDIFGHGGENLNKGFRGPSIYLVPVWTSARHLANITGFRLIYTTEEDPNRTSLTVGPKGRYVYLQPTFDPQVEDRIIGLQLFRSRNCNPPQYGWPLHTPDVNDGRGGDHLSLQWDLGREGDLPGYKYRFNRR